MKNKTRIIAVIAFALVLVGLITVYLIYTGGEKDKFAPEETSVTTQGEAESSTTPSETTAAKTIYIEPITTTDATEATTKTIVQEIFSDATKPEIPDETPASETSMADDNKPPVVITTAPENDEPQMGDTSDGYFWIDGFGWIVDEGGEVKYDIIDSDGDIDKIVGIM